MGTYVTGIPLMIRNYQPPINPVTQISVNKVITGAPLDDQTFHINLTSVDGYNAVGVPITQSQPLVFVDLPYGIYTVEESDSYGYLLDSIVPSTFTINADNPQQVVTITNYLLGEMTISKVITDYPFDETIFDVTITGRNTAYTDTQTINQDTPIVLSDIPADVYDIEESTVEGYLLSSIVDNPAIIDNDNLSIEVLITNEIDVGVVATICNDDELRFDSYEDSLIGLLTVGEVVGDGYTIGDYLIEWHKDSPTGEIVFISGIGDNPLIQQTHPFENQPVPSGILYSVIKTIVIDDATYSSDFDHEITEVYSPDLILCLPTVETPYIIVDKLRCGNSLNPSGDYTHVIAYNNIADPLTDKSREITFYLNEDGTTNYFAIEITAYDIADRFKISYCTELDSVGFLIEDLIDGMNTTGMNWVSDPLVLQPLAGFQSYKFVINLEGYTYTLGDYIKIEVIPSYYDESELNTNWRVAMICLSGTVGVPYDFTMIPFAATLQEIDVNSIAMIWNSELCRYELSFDLGDSIEWVDLANTDQYKYISMGAAAEGMPLYSFYNSAQGGISNLHRTIASGWNILSPLGGCTNLTGTITVDKTLHTITMTFTDEDEYLQYKSEYNTQIASPHWTDYDADPLEFTHYKYWFMQFRVALSCGDAGELKFYVLSYDSIFSFNDSSFKITITLVEDAPIGYIDAECEFSSENFGSYLGLANATYGLSNFSFVTHTNMTGTANIRGIYFTKEVIAETNSVGGWCMYYSGIESNGINEIGTLDPRFSGAYDNEFYRYKLWRFHARCAIVPSDTPDPINNFEVYNNLDANGHLDTGHPTLIYKILDGIVIVP